MQELTHAEWMSLFVLAINAAGEAKLEKNNEATHHYIAVANKCTLNADAIERRERAEASTNHAKLMSDDRKAYVEATRLSRLQQENPDDDVETSASDAESAQRDRNFIARGDS